MNALAAVRANSGRMRCAANRWWARQRSRTAAGKGSEGAGPRGRPWREIVDYAVIKRHARVRGALTSLYEGEGATDVRLRRPRRFPTLRSCRSRVAGANAKRREGSRSRSPLRQCKHRRGRGGGPLTSVASLSASQPSRRRRTYPARAPPRKGPRAPIPAICGEIRGARCVNSTPETTRMAAITVRTVSGSSSRSAAKPSPNTGTSSENGATVPASSSRSR